MEVGQIVVLKEPANQGIFGLKHRFGTGEVVSGQYGVVSKVYQESNLIGIEVEVDFSSQKGWKGLTNEFDTIHSCEVMRKPESRFVVGLKYMVLPQTTLDKYYGEHQVISPQNLWFKMVYTTIGGKSLTQQELLVDGQIVTRNMCIAINDVNIIMCDDAMGGLGGRRNAQIYINAASVGIDMVEEDLLADLEEEVEEAFGFEDEEGDTPETEHTEVSRIQYKDFPWCCTARILGKFGGSSVAVAGYLKLDKDTIVESLKIEIERAKHCGLAMVVVTTNDEQVSANDALRELGFTSSHWMVKPEHIETRTRLWWLPLFNDDDEVLERNEKARKRIA